MKKLRPLRKYLELAKTLYRVEADKAKLASLSSQIISDETGAPPLPVTDVTDQSKEILLGRSKYVGMSVPDASFIISGKRESRCMPKNCASVSSRGECRSEEKRR